MVQRWDRLEVLELLELVGPEAKLWKPHSEGSNEIPKTCQFQRDVPLFLFSPTSPEVITE